MKAIRLTGVGEPLELEDVPVPQPREDEVLIRVAGCGICHTDIGFWKDGVPTRRALPLTLGHEISGTIVRAGAGSPHPVGREVIVPSVIPCGACRLCDEGRGNVCRSQLMPGNDMDGGFAEFVVVPARGLCPIDATGGYPLAELSVIADAVTTPYQAVVRSGLGAGDLAIVVGAGGIGAHCVQIAAAFGARVVAIDIDEHRLATIAEHGADLTIDSAGTDFKTLKKRVAAHAAEQGIDPYGWKIFECSGAAAGQTTAFGLLTHASVLLVVGFTLARTEIRLSNLMAFDATAQGSWGCRPELYPDALALVTSGRITLEPFIETHPMSRGLDVLQKIADHEVTRRAILIPDWDS